MRDFRPGGTPTGGLFAVFNPYPPARGDRRKPIGANSELPQTVSVPRVYTFNFHVREGGNPSRALVSSRRLAGPVFVDTLSYDITQGATGTLAVMQIGWSRSPQIEGINLSGDDLPNVTWLHDLRVQSDSPNLDPGHEGFTHGVATTNQHNRYRFGVAIQAAELFIVASIRSMSNNVCVFNGSLRVLENVEPDLLAELVLS